MMALQLFKCRASSAEAIWRASGHRQSCLLPVERRIELDYRTDIARGWRHVFGKNVLIRKRINKNREQYEINPF